MNVVQLTRMLLVAHHLGIVCAWSGSCDMHKNVTMFAAFENQTTLLTMVHTDQVNAVVLTHPCTTKQTFSLQVKLLGRVVTKLATQRIFYSYWIIACITDSEHAAGIYSPRNGSKKLVLAFVTGHLLMQQMRQICAILKIMWRYCFLLLSAHHFFVFYNSGSQFCRRLGRQMAQALDKNRRNKHDFCIAVCRGAVLQRSETKVCTGNQQV